MPERQEAMTAGVFHNTWRETDARKRRATGRDAFAEAQVQHQSTQLAGGNWRRELGRELVCVHFPPFLSRGKTNRYSPAAIQRGGVERDRGSRLRILKIVIRAAARPGSRSGGACRCGGRRPRSE